MGTNMYPSSALLGQNRDESIMALNVDELIEKADGFAGVFPGKFILYICVTVFIIIVLVNYVCKSIPLTPPFLPSLWVKNL